MNKFDLNYVKEQLELHNIEYHVINEKNTFMECNMINTNRWIKYIASSGYIMGYTNDSGERGINDLIKILTRYK